LVVGDTVAVEIRLQVTVRPCVESSVFGSIGLLSKIASDRGVAGTARLGGRGILVLSLLEEFITVGVGVLLGLLSVGFEVLAEVFNSPSIKCPGRPASGSLVFVQSD